MSYITYEVKVYDSGNKKWFLNEELHREDGPAIEWNDGTKEWWLDGKLHREDGPAIEDINGKKHWYLNGKLHREDGPAIECANGDKRWWLNGAPISKEEFNARQQSCAGQIVEVNGKKYKLVEE